MSEKVEYTGQVKNCARCGQDHGIIWKHLTNPPELLTHFGICRVTQEPVFATIGFSKQWRMYYFDPEGYGSFSVVLATSPEEAREKLLAYEFKNGDGTPDVISNEEKHKIAKFLITECDPDVPFMGEWC